MKKAVYTGSFDPITLGHMNVIERSSRLVDRLIIGIGINIEKTGLFDSDERMDLVRRVTNHLKNVEVRSFEGLAVNFVAQCDAKVMIRGVRPLTDIAAEFTMMMANRQLNDELETVFLMADGEYAHVSSTLIKQITPLADDEQLARFVPQQSFSDLAQKNDRLIARRHIHEPNRIGYGIQIAVAVCSAMVPARYPAFRLRRPNTRPRFSAFHKRERFEVSRFQIARPASEITRWRCSRHLD